MKGQFFTKLNVRIYFVIAMLNILSQNVNDYMYANYTSNISKMRLNILM